MIEDNPPQSIPPIDAMPTFDEPPRTRWPTVFGVLSIIFAILGLCCFTLQGLWLAIMDAIPEMYRGGVSMPLGLRLALMALIVPTLILGVMLLVGGIGLLRRKRASVKLMKRWAILRIIMLLVGLMVTIVTGPAQIQIQKQVYDFQVKMYEQAKKAPPPPKSDQQIWREILIQSGVITFVLAIYPFVVGMYFSRKKIDAEVELWR